MHKGIIVPMRNVRLYGQSSNSPFDELFPEWNEEEVNKNDNTSNRASSSNSSSNEKKLGINIGSYLDPLSEREANELKAAAAEIVNDAVASGLDEIERMRQDFRQQIEDRRRQAQAQSEAMAQRESKKLMNKIDQITSQFLASTEESRKATQIAYAADQAMEKQGLEIGAWGTWNGASVLLGGATSSSDTTSRNMEEDTSDMSTTTTTAIRKKNRVCILADAQSDEYAKLLVDPLVTELSRILKVDRSSSQDALQVNVYPPTATVPLGADNAAAVIVFCTSFTSADSVRKLLSERVLRKTMLTNGQIAQPPTQIFAISTVGTERIEKLPYSWQNLMGGGKLENRRQIEESIMRIVRDRPNPPSLDYTICKLGTLTRTATTTNPTESSFRLEPGDPDGVDGNLSVDTAVHVLAQAMLLQPSARNATLSVKGELPAMQDDQQQRILDDAFLKLDGPELLRIQVDEGDEKYESLVQYVTEWAEALADGGKLTTPIRMIPVDSIPERQRMTAYHAGVQRIAAVQVLFLPTNTGKTYVSRQDELRQQKTGAESGRSKVPSKLPRDIRSAREGGIEFLVEVLDDVDATIRVRARRCNYGDDAVIKELSEETILGRFRESIEVWKKEYRG
jgi:hypothetical protein